MGHSGLVCLDLTGPGSVQAGVPVEGEVAVHHPLEVHVDDCLRHLRHHCRRLGRKERGEMVGVPGWKVRGRFQAGRRTTCASGSVAGAPRVRKSRRVSPPYEGEAWGGGEGGGGGGEA